MLKTVLVILLTLLVLDYLFTVLLINYADEMIEGISTLITKYFDRK